MGAEPTLPAAVVGHDLAARDAKAAAAAAKTNLEVITAQVQIAMQCATATVDRDGAAVAKWVGSKGRTTIDTAALTADLPDVAATYMRTGTPVAQSPSTGEGERERMSNALAIRPDQTN